MDCSLWLNRKKIDSAAQIPDNLDVASLRGYFLAGSLIEWLKEHGGKRYAAKLAKLSYDDPSLNEKIAAIFGGAPLPSKPLDGNARCYFDITGCDTHCSYFSGSAGSLKLPDWLSSANLSSGISGSYLNYLEISSFLTYLSGKYAWFVSTSFSETSFSRWEWLLRLLNGYSGGSFVSTSFSETSFSRWEWLLRLLNGYSGGSFVSTSFSETSFSQWEWLLRLLWGYSSGSFVSTSFSETSFSQWEWLLRLLSGYSSGSFVSTSFSETSFSQWEWLLRLLLGYSSGSFVSTSFSETGSSQWERFFEMFGSFGGGSFSQMIPFMDEYDFIMLKTLMICPLDRFGYGIHII